MRGSNIILHMIIVYEADKSYKTGDSNKQWRKFGSLTVSDNAWKNKKTQNKRQCNNHVNGPFRMYVQLFC